MPEKTCAATKNKKQNALNANNVLSGMVQGGPAIHHTCMMPSPMARF